MSVCIAMHFLTMALCYVMLIKHLSVLKYNTDFLVILLICHAFIILSSVFCESSGFHHEI